MLDDVKPQVPGWALNAGVPKPEEGESYRDYVSRLGLDPDELLIELTDQTAEFANRRLAHALRLCLPHAWRHFLNAYCAARIPLERRRELRRWADNVIPGGSAHG